MKNDNAFARSRAMFAAISALIAQGLKGFELQQQVNVMRPYKSRGKGRGKAFDRQRHGNPPGMNYGVPACGGAREIARRKRQIERGILKISA
jgi:hypothetical protein